MATILDSFYVHEINGCYTVTLRIYSSTTLSLDLADEEHYVLLLFSFYLSLLFLCACVAG